ncbi:hypothetical protein PSTG_08086 [Puccinia striiformis f. sp. tritici PST-78]|uniref:Uncharacterized protein n=1 Tax=Puccinia striiformis f. sp. tritici PST-78 TaxID=1165861 RepID=A0A0L0VHF3_9BASI|nr:hypothetical protein PSTG_08086 [Puccinia striiformis f. sp. tritici PST-78]
MNIQPWLRRMMIQLLAPEEEPNSGPDEDSSVHESEVDLDNKDKYLSKGDLEEDKYLSKGDLEEGSGKDEEQDQYTSGSCKQTLAKIRAIAKKLRYSPNVNTEFVDCCVAKGCKKPHNISRDCHKRHGVECKYHLDDSDFDLARDLVQPQATGMLAGLSSATAAQGGNNSSDPSDIWLSGGLILEDHKPVNPLKWWIQQKRAGNTHGGLVHMALDILSCPGETCMLLD